MKSGFCIKQCLSLSNIFTFSALSYHANRMLLMCLNINNACVSGFGSKVFTLPCLFSKPCNNFRKIETLVWGCFSRTCLSLSVDAPLPVSHLIFSVAKKIHRGGWMYFQCVAQIQINSDQQPYLLCIFIAFVIANCCTWNFHNGATKFNLFGGDHEIFHHKVISRGEKGGAGLYFNRFKYMKGFFIPWFRFSPLWLSSKLSYGQTHSFRGVFHLF